ncbi:MAG: ATP-binding cassette domain-containing protein [Betaproteobacteria bacterium]|nr:ATP-binding cassette domain-containing protein [Betaproteobacteria bacterium]
MSLPPSLTVSNLAFRVGNHVVLDALNFSIGAGIVWIRGPNGAGKTTLLKLLGGALTANFGEIKLSGLSLSSMTARQREAVFLCTDDLPRLPWLTAGELVAVYASIYPGIDKVTLNLYLENFKLIPVLSTSIETMSLGERRKLHLAVALSVNSSLLLLDEALNALDASAADQVRQELQRRHDSASQIIIITSHIDPRVTTRVFDLRGGTDSRLDEASVV